MYFQPSGGEDGDLQTLHDLQKLMMMLGEPSELNEEELDKILEEGEEEEGKSSVSDGMEKANAAEEGRGKGPSTLSLITVLRRSPSTDPEIKIEEDSGNGDGTAVAAKKSPIGTEECCAKCQRPMQRQSLGPVDEVKTEENSDSATSAATSTSTGAAEGDEGGGSRYDSEVMMAERFKLMREASRLREELAKKRFAELAVSVKLEEAEEEVKRLTEQVKEKEALVTEKEAAVVMKGKELEDTQMQLMDYVSQVHEVGQKVQLLTKERDDFVLLSRPPEMIDSMSQTFLIPCPIEMACQTMDPPLLMECAAQKNAAPLPVERGCQNRVPVPVEKGCQTLLVPARVERGCQTPEPMVVEEEEEEEMWAEPVLLEEDEKDMWKRVIDHVVNVDLQTVGQVIVVVLSFLLLLSQTVPSSTNDSTLHQQQPSRAQQSTYPSSFDSLPTWAGQRSPLRNLTAGGANLAPGDFITNCDYLPTSPCINPYFLWMQHDGNLVLYRGHSPVDHRGPIWSTHTTTSIIPSHSQSNNDDEREGERGWENAEISAYLTERNELQLLDASGRKRWSRKSWRIPQELSPWPFALRKW